MKNTTPTIVPTVVVPTEHRVTTVVSAHSTYCLYGFRAYDTTARFTLISIGATAGDTPDVILDAQTWSVTWKRLVTDNIVEHKNVQALLESLTP